MAIFKYIYLTKDGKKNSGVISCEKESDVVEKINCSIVSIKKINCFFVGIKNNDLVKFFTHLLFQTRSGISIFEAISSYIDICDNVAMQAILASVCQKMLAGCTLFDAILSENVFGKVIPSLIHSAEVSGNLDDSLNCIITYLKFQEKIRLKIKKASLYPIIVLFISFFAFFFCLACLGPQVQEFVNERGQSSLITEICLFLIPNEFNFILISIFALILSAILFIFRGKNIVKFIYMIPVFRGIIKQFYEWNCCTIMYISTVSQIGIISMIKLLISTLEDTPFCDDFSRVLIDITGGAKLSQSLANVDIFSKGVVSIVKIGEENNEMSAALKNIVEMKNEEIIFSINRLGTSIGAIITAITGFLLTFILLGLYYPLYSSIDVIEM